MSWASRCRTNNCWRLTRRIRVKSEKQHNEKIYTVCSDGGSGVWWRLCFNRGWVLTDLGFLSFLKLLYSGLALQEVSWGKKSVGCTLKQFSLRNCFSISQIMKEMTSKIELNREFRSRTIKCFFFFVKRTSISFFYIIFTVYSVLKVLHSVNNSNTDDNSRHPVAWVWTHLFLTEK